MDTKIMYDDAQPTNTVTRALPVLAIMAMTAVFCCRAVSASIGGAEIAEPLGWIPSTSEVFFQVAHYDDSHRANTIVRLVLGAKDHLFQPLKWSERSDVDDVSYARHLRELQARLHPLVERRTSTIAENETILRLRNLTNTSGHWLRYQVCVSWFNGICEGKVQAVVYREPSLRMLRVFAVRDRMIGVFSFVGQPFEVGYEIQIPALLPRANETVVLPDYGGR